MKIMKTVRETTKRIHNFFRPLSPLRSLRAKKQVMKVTICDREEEVAESILRI